MARATFNEWKFEKNIISKFDEINQLEQDKHMHIINNKILE